MRAEIIFTQITLFASISFTSFYHVITLTMRTEHWNEHHRSFLCFSLLSLFAKIQYNINQLKYPDVKHDRRLLGVLFYAAAQLCSVFAACSRLREAPSAQAVRNALVALCPEPRVLEQQFNRSFASQLPKALRRR